MNRPMYAAALAVLVLATGVAVAEGTRREPVPVSPSAAVTQVARERTTLVCPDVRTAEGISTRLAIATTGAAPSTGPASEIGGPSRVTVRPLAPDAVPRPVPGMRRPGTAVADVEAPADSGPLVVSATGALAPGLVATQLTRGDDGVHRGFAAVRCSPPDTDVWHLAAATTVGIETTLLLSNPTDADAIVDVSFLGLGGRLRPSAGHGIRVEPQQQLAVPLATLAPDQPYLAVHVVTRVGQVASAVRQLRGTEHTSLGVEWLPPTEPARRIVLPGTPPGEGRRALLLSNPRELDTTVRIRRTGVDGSFVPVGWKAVEVPAGSTVSVQLAEQLDGAVETLTVHSEGGPVMAALLADRPSDRSELHETAWVGSARPLTGPTAVPQPVLGPETDTALVLAAPEGGAVTLRPLAVAGQPPAGQQAEPPRTVTLRPGRTTSIPIDGPEGARGAPVLVTPEAGGPVYATTYLREVGSRGPLFSVLPVRTAPTTVPAPAVHPDPAAARPG